MSPQKNLSLTNNGLHTRAVYERSGEAAAKDAFRLEFEAQGFPATRLVRITKPGKLVWWRAENGVTESGIGEELGVFRDRRTCVTGIGRRGTMEDQVLPVSADKVTPMPGCKLP